METSKKISINLSSLFATANNKSNVDLSSLVVRYKNSKPLNRPSVVLALIGSAIVYVVANDSLGFGVVGDFALILLLPLFFF